MKKRMSKKVLTLIMSIVILFTLTFEVNTINASAASIPRVKYCACLKNIGWQQFWVWDGQTAGTTGESKPTEGFSIYVENTPNGSSIQYRTYSQGFGWLNWVSNGQLSNTALNGARVDAQAIQIRLTGELAQKYDVVYRAHSAYYGWLDWVRNGETAGRFEENLRIEAIQVKLVEKANYRALSLGNFNVRDESFMRDFFINKGIQTTCISSPSKYTMVNTIQNLNTKDSDITYIYMSCHGGTDGGVGIGGGFSPNDLKNILDKKPGTFVLMLDSCYSGKSVETNVFNTLGLFGSSSKYKMITSCNGSETSGANDISTATCHWAYGSGYSYYKAGYFAGDVGTLESRANSSYNRILNYLPADSNSDGYVTLKELANFSNKRMKQYGGGQTVLYYPNESDFVLFK